MTAQSVASHVLELYSSLAFRPPPGQFTVLASLVLVSTETIKVISLATGSKCLPVARLPKQGDALHDSHAEILARRAAIRWFLEEIIRSVSAGVSQWIELGDDDRYGLKYGIRVFLYISTPPCKINYFGYKDRYSSLFKGGDASTRFLACSQDQRMAALKDSTVYPVLPRNSTSRGRDNYSLYGVLRTKPGRADAPPTGSMSCSDKIAVWNVVGMQGALASRVLKPIYISGIVIGDVADSMQDIVQEDCDRAIWGRLRNLNGRY